jgi:hypothetical protein
MDDPVETPPTSANTTRKCSKPWCHIMLDNSDKRKACATCRERDRNNQKSKTQRDSASADTTDRLRKRRRGSMASADGRPTARLRRNQSLEGVGDEGRTGAESDDEMLGSEEDDNNVGLSHSPPHLNKG